MAFTDFNLLGTQTTVLHSAAPLTTNPLSASLAGTYCRKLQYNLGSTNQIPKIYFTSSSYGGAFYNVPNTKVISARAHLRYENNTTSNVLTIKDTTTFNSGYSTLVKGYSFGIGPRTSDAVGNGPIYLHGNNNSILISKTSPFGTSLTADTWYSLRMDVFPLGAAADRIICYMEVNSSGSSTSSPGSGIWNSTILGTSFDITVSSVNPAYAPWSSNAMNGISARNIDYNTQSGIGYVDNINFTTYNAP